MHLSTALKITAVAASVLQAHSFRINFYRSHMCNGEQVGVVEGGAELGCQHNESSHAGVANSVIVKRSDGDGDDDLMLVFFRSTDCDPETEITHVDDTTGGCIDGDNFGSWAVWDVTEGE